jgi:hypothetical protein
MVVAVVSAVLHLLFVGALPFGSRKEGCSAARGLLVLFRSQGLKGPISSFTFS